MAEVRGFAKLSAVRRGHQTFHCVAEARDKLFSGVSDRALSDWTRFLSIDILAASDEENQSLAGKLSTGPRSFWLISESDLSRLYNFSGSPHPFTSRAVFSPSISGNCSAMPFHASRDDNSVPEMSNVASASATATATSTAVTSDSSRSARSAQSKEKCTIDLTDVSPAPSLTESASSNVPLHSSALSVRSPGLSPGGERSIQSTSLQVETEGAENETRNKGDVAETGSISDHRPSEAGLGADSENGGEGRKSVVLSESEMTPELRDHMARLRRYYTDGINFNRQGCALQPSTVHKMVERASGFLWFAKHMKGLEPTLSICADPILVQEFAHFLIEQRKLKSVTASRYVSAFISVVKVLNSERGESSVCPSALEKLRTIQRQLEASSKKERLALKATKPVADKKIVYPELLELCRELKWQVDELSGIEQARCAMDLCLILLYASANPGRVKEYVTLRIYSGQSAHACLDQNFICFNEDDTVVLIENDYKTKNTYGPSRTELSELPFLVYYLRVYRQKLRPRLLMGSTHDYFFVNHKGQPFSGSSFTGYISALFDKHFSVKLTTNDLRKCVVDYFLSLPESGDYTLRESLAAVMKHSVRTQKRHYDERPLAEKKSRAIAFLGSMASRAMETEAVEIDCIGEDDEGFLDALPSNGELVALVASDSTLGDPKVLVAKVLRYSQDRKTVYLAHYAEVEACKFKLEAGKCYTERANSIIYPVDIAYHYSSGLYELRTSKLDIHNQVRSRK